MDNSELNNYLGAIAQILPVLFLVLTVELLRLGTMSKPSDHWRTRSDIRIFRYSTLAVVTGETFVLIGLTQANDIDLDVWYQSLFFIWIPAFALLVLFGSIITMLANAKIGTLEEMQGAQSPHPS